MKKSFFLLIAVLFFQSLYGQNIPRANYSGPWGMQVNTYNGNLFFARQDLVIPNQGLSLEFSLAYNSFRDTIDLGFGRGWTFSYAMHYETIGADTVVVEWPDGRRDLYVRNGAAFTAPAGIFDTWEAQGSGQFRLTTKYGMVYDFENPTHKRLTRIQDVNGNQITLAYNGHELATVTDHSGRSVGLSWSGGHLTTLTDANASSVRTVQLTYGGDLLTAVTDPLGQITTYGYDANCGLTQIVDERGDELKIRCNAEGRVAEMATCLSTVSFLYNRTVGKTYVTEKNSGGDRITTYEYDEEGKLLRKTGNCCGYNVQYGYDESNNINQLTDANGHAMAASHDGMGNTLFTTDVEGASQSFGFEPQRNRLTNLTDKRGNASTFEYDANGNLRKIQQPENVEVEFTHDGAGNVTSMRDGNGHTSTMTYNAHNDLTSIQYPIGQETFGYDGVGNMLSSTDGNGNSVQYSYDALNRVVGISDDLGHAVQYAYDPASNLTQETDANGQVRSFGYDAHHRLQAVTTPAGTTQYGYDASDNLTAITDANQHTRTFDYDRRDLLTTERDPLGHSTAYTYDGNGNVLTRTDPNGKVTTYTYDRLNRLTAKTYDGNTDSYAYDANGNLVQCANSHISMSFVYDGLNRLTSKTVHNWGLTISYEYDRVGNRTKMTDPAGVTTYTYDTNNRLTSITNPAGETTAFVYDTGGRLIRQNYHNGAYAEYTYDAANRLLLLANKNAGGALIAQYAYTYDANGNRLSMTTLEGTATYAYDGDNRLLSATYTGITANAENYQYDGAGNRTTLNGTPYTYDAADRLQSAGSTTYGFDANGNLTLKSENGQTTHYHYDGENRLVRVVLPSGEELAFQYDPFGNRIGQAGQGATTRYLLDGDNVLMELDAAGNTLARYTAGLTLDSWISMERGGQSYFYHTDGLGSTTALTDGSQAVAAAYQYDAYGKLLAQTGAVTNPYTYTGREYDAATGLYYYRTRYYDAAVGRFLTRDGFPGFKRRPLSLNNYTYAENNPIVFNDPKGEFIPLLKFAFKLGIYGYRAYVLYNELKSTYNTIKDLITRKFQFASCDDILSRIEGKLFNEFDDVLYDLIEKSAKRGVLELANSFKESGLSEEVYKYMLGEMYRYLKEDLVKTEAYQNFMKKCNEFIDDFNDSLPDQRGGGHQESFPLPSPPNAGSPNPGTGSGGGFEFPIDASYDPNEIIAPEGCGVERWVAGSATLPYTILYENDPDFATAPAQTVFIEHIFDEEINPFSFRLGDFGFGSYYFNVPANVSYYSTRIDLSDSLNVLLDVTAGLDAANRRVFWILESKDPATGFAATLPASVGFLPVNDTLTRAGEGFVNFTVRPRNTAATGDTIHAVADIIFDDNLPIRTNLAFNRVDADAPLSEITAIDTLPDHRYRLHWTGSDEGSGIVRYLLYASVNEDAYLPLADNLTASPYTFQGLPDSTYRFFTVAVDCAGNIEPLKDSGCTLVLADTTVVQPVGMAANGSIALAVNGAVGNVTYTWSPEVSTTATATSLSPGVYAVTVTDLLGCSLSLALELDAIVSTTTPAARPNDLFIHRLYPVPAHAELTVEFSAPARHVWLEVFGPDGKPLLAQTLDTQPGQLNQTVLDLSRWPSGSYTVRIRTRTGSVSGVFLRQ